VSEKSNFSPIKLSKPRILLLGVGYTLEVLLSKFLSKEFEPVCVVRSTEKEKNFSNLGFKTILFDVCKPNDFENAFRDYNHFDVVVDSVPPPDINPTNQVYKNYQISLSELSKISKNSIYLSTTGVFGGLNGEIITEESVCSPKTDRAKIRLETENTHQKYFLNSTSLRIPAIYGPGRGIGHALKQKRYKLIGDGLRFTNRIHVFDLARVINKLCELKLDNINCPKILCVSDQKIATQLEVVNFYVEKFNLEFPPIIPLERAFLDLDSTLLSNQQVFSAKCWELSGLSPLYPSYIEGAYSEFES
jgi:nucleoside-diphosphate-sugar epimerase